MHLHITYENFAFSHTALRALGRPGDTGTLGLIRYMNKITLLCINNNIYYVLNTWIKVNNMLVI